MTRSTISPIRRIAAVAAIAGVTGLGAVALAPSAFAETAPAPDSAAAADSAAATDSAPAAKPAPAPKPKPGPDPLAPTTTHYTTVTGPNGQPWIVSPMPEKAIAVKIGHFTIKLTGIAAQTYQSVEANLDVQKGQNVWFDLDGLLKTGPQPCDPTVEPADQIGCVAGHGPRF